MDERDNLQEQPEDLEVRADEAEQVKGGAGITANDDWESPVAIQADGSVRPGGLRSRDGLQANHNEALVAL